MLHQGESPSTHGRTGLALLLVAAGAAALFVAAAVPNLYKFWRAADYPGAVRLSNHSKLSLTNLSLRHDTSFRTKDAFPVVYNWYSSGQRLGPESHAQSACILMEHSLRLFYVVDRYMGVTLCDTRNGRMIFVTRIVAVRKP